MSDPRIWRSSFTVKIVGLTCALILSSSSDAQDTEFRINSYTPSEQRQPEVAAFDDGGFIVVWRSRLFPSGSTTANVIARRFDGALMPIGDDFLVGALDTQISQPQVATQPNGGFMVVWTARHYEPVFRAEVWSRVFSSTGAAMGPASVLNAERGYPMIESDDLGRFTLLWGNSDGLQLQRLNADGSTLGEESFVFAAPSFGGIDLATRGDGGSMVFWSDTTAYRFRRFDAHGASASVPTVAPFGGVGAAEIVATDEGYYLLGSPNFSDLVGHRVDPTGAALGSEHVVPSFGGIRALRGLAHHPETGFGFVRQTHGVPQDESLSGIEQGRLSTAGKLLSRHQANTYTTDLQREPDITALSDGTYLVVWESIFSDSGDPNYSVQGRRILDDLLVDDFESGDTSAWGTFAP